MRQVLNIAHRGASSVAPENTLPAFAAAVEAGADWLELDVRMTADGRLAVIHDETVTRTTRSRGRVERMTFAALSRLDAGAWFAEQFAGTRIPALEEVIEIADGRVGLLIEVKDPRGRAAEIWDVLAGTLKGFDGEYVVQSFDAEFVRMVKRVAPGTRAALLTKSVRALAVAADIGADAVNVGIRSAAAGLVPAVKAAGLGCFVWTIKSARSLKAALEYDVDGVITNYPRETRAVLDSLEKAAAEDFAGSPPQGEAFIKWRQRKLKNLKGWRPPRYRTAGVRG